MSRLFGADLPTPESSALTLYLLGPGIGESIVAIMPDSRAVVVDVCEHSGVNLTVALLDTLGVNHVDLLVVSHPDLDHIRGLNTLIQTKPPTELWRYPLEARAREFALGWAKRRKNSPLSNALEALGKFLRLGDGETFSAVYGDRVWPHDTQAYRVNVLAPTTYDVDLAMRAWDRRLARGPAALDRWLDDVSAGRRPIGDAPNVVSLALTIEMGSRKVLLGGDVLCGTKSPKSGWKGIQRLLKAHGRLHMLQALAAVKVPHHGSLGAFDAHAWQHHATGAELGEPVALIAPFSPSALPHAQTLTELKAYARTLLVTEAGKAGAAVVAAAGWNPMAPHVVRMLATAAPCVALRIASTGPLQMFASAGALAAA